MPAPPVIAFSSRGEPAEEVGTSRATLEVSKTTPTDLRLEASALRDYKLAYELFTGMLLPTDANELLDVP